MRLAACGFDVVADFVVVVAAAAAAAAAVVVVVVVVVVPVAHALPGFVGRLWLAAACGLRCAICGVRFAVVVFVVDIVVDDVVVEVVSHAFQVCICSLWFVVCG